MNRSIRRAIWAQTRLELMLTLRRGENLLVTIIVPLLLMVFFASSGLVPASDRGPMDFLVPGLLAVAIISTGMVNLGIATAYERYYGVLKRLGGSPLPRWGLLLAKAFAILAIEIVQVILLLGVAMIGYGWRPLLQGPAAVAGLALGTIAFSAFGLAMAGGLRAEATLGIANGLYLVFLLLGDVLLPVSHLPALLQPISRVLPVTALSEILRFAFAGAPIAPLSSLLLLTAWAVFFVVVAARSFRWE